VLFRSVPVRPGEVSLAHAGVLFLDDVIDFRPAIVARLKADLREGEVRVSRAGVETVFPAQPIVVLSATCCPCGNRGSSGRNCICKRPALERHVKRIREVLPLADIIASVAPLDVGQHRRPSEASRDIRRRVIAARNRQARRFAEHETEEPLNARLRIVDLVPAMDERASDVFRSGIERLDISTSEHAKILRLARTIADLDGSDVIRVSHVVEGLTSVARQDASLRSPSSA